MVFGDRIFKEGIKAKLGLKGGALSDRIIKRRRNTELTLSPFTQRRKAE